MPVQLIDEVCQHVNSAMFIATCSGPPQMKTDAEYPVSTTVQVVLLNCPPGFVYSNESRR